MDTCTLNYNPPIPYQLCIYIYIYIYIRLNENMKVERFILYTYNILGVNKVIVRIHVVTIYIKKQ